jgi:hypothetical protein
MVSLVSKSVHVHVAVDNAEVDKRFDFGGGRAITVR